MGGGVQEEEAAGAPPTAAMVVPPVLVKGKRSKRQRVHAPPVVLSSAAAPEWSSSAASAATAPAEEESGTSRSDEAASSAGCLTEEDEDMALCLMLLARGVPAAAKDDDAVVVAKEARFRSRRPADGAAAGEYVYECKTCNKCFPTFQALGGHRASHKKPRLAGADDEIAINVVTASNTAIKQQQRPPMATASPPPALQPPQMDVAVFPDVTTALSLNSVAAISSSKLRVHECSICGAEFASGQALGGHMRRHRPLNAPERAVTAIAGTDTKKEGSASINLELDLNLPAPSDEEAVVSLPAAVVLGLGPLSDGKKAGLMRTASALVDCHY